jgi:hypothetical protein
VNTIQRSVVYTGSGIDERVEEAPMPALESLTDHLSRWVVESLPTPGPALGTLAALLVVPVRFVAFWLAALLPLTYLPLLVGGVVADHPTAFLAVLFVNSVAFVLGHGHRRPET